MSQSKCCISRRALVTQWAQSRCSTQLSQPPAPHAPPFSESCKPTKTDTCRMYQQHELKLPKMKQSKTIIDFENTTEPLHHNQGPCQQSFSLSCLSACSSNFHQKTEICHPEVPKFLEIKGSNMHVHYHVHISEDSETNIQWIIK